MLWNEREFLKNEKLDTQLEKIVFHNHKNISSRKIPKKKKSVIRKFNSIKNLKSPT